MFKDSERVEMIKECIKDYKNVIVVNENSLTVDACRKYGAKFILRGLRSSADFEFEFEANNVNNALEPEIETILVMTNIDESHISSSTVRELINYESKEYKKLVPIEVYEYIENRRK